MKKTKSTNAFMFAFLAVVIISGGASFYFYQQMSSQFVLISDGLTPKTQILNIYKYNQFKTAMIIALTTLGSSACLLIMLIIPDDSAPQAYREEGHYPHEMEMGPSSISAEIGPDMGAAGLVGGMDPAVAAIEPAIDSIDTEGLDMFDEIEAEVTEGEDDVVYGNGEISNIAIIDFVHKHPDSSIKFLFRKQLDGKTLTSDEEDIYHVWEQRGMTRGKVKSYILSMMEWDSFPKEPLYELWKKLRDHIFENFQ